MVRFAHGVLISEGLYVLQLRDDKPGIAAPGVWSLFGGSVEKHESTKDALIREVQEELCVRIEHCRELWVVERYSAFVQVMALYSFFQSVIETEWSRHRLMEGQAVGRFSYSQLLSLPMVPIMREALARHHRQSALPLR